MSSGLRFPYPFPQPVGPPPGYTTVHTYPVLYGSEVYLLVDRSYYVVGSRDLPRAGKIGPRAPGVSERIPADPYQILDSNSGVPRDPHHRPLPVKYGDSIMLRNVLTGEFWRVDRGILYGAYSNINRSGTRFLISSSVPNGNVVSAFVAGTFPKHYPQVNEMMLSTPSGQVVRRGNLLGLERVGGSPITMVLAHAPSPRSGAPWSRDLVTGLMPGSAPLVWLPPVDDISPILPPKGMHYQRPPSPIYDYPYPRSRW